MNNKAQYYKLDEIGFVGGQEKKSRKKIKEDIARTTEIIKRQKSKKLSSNRKTPLIKAK